MATSFSEDLQKVLLKDPNVQPSAAQRKAIVQKLQAWVRAQSAVPDTDERLWGMLRLIPLLVDQIELRLNETGLTVTVQGRLSGTALLLSRGASWFKGGDWETVVLACVVRKN